MRSTSVRVAAMDATRRCALLVAAVLPAGCDEAGPGSEALATLQEEVASRAEAATSTDPSVSRVLRESAPYLGRVGAVVEPEASLPTRVEGPEGFSWTTGGELPSSEVAARITKATGIPVALDAGLPEEQSRIREGAPAIRYSGPLSGFLDLLGSQWDTGWIFRNGVVTIFDRVFKTYSVRASVAQSSLSLETADAGTETGSLSTGVQLESSAWQEIDATLAGIVDRGTYNMSPSAGLVSVNAPPSVHAAVSEYLARANAIFDARISIQVAVAFLDVTNLDDHGLSLNLLASVLGDRVELQLGRESASTAPGVASVKILDSATGGLARYAGSTAMLRALSRTNRVIDYRTANAITRHGSPVPIRLSRRQDIVSRVTVTVTGEGSTTSVESETLDTGMSISVLPRLIEPGKVHLTLSLVASDLVSLVPYQANAESKVQLATVDERRLTHDFVIEDDELAILAGYEQRRAGGTSEDIGHSGLLLLGGSRASDSTRTRLYLFVSARTIP